MIIQFNFSNYKTFKERVVLNMIASNYDKTTNEEDNVINLEKRDLRIVKSSVIYGPNAAGKSKFIDAVTFFRKFILSSSKDALQQSSIGAVPFRLNSETKNKPSDFEMMFIMDEVIYRYGFEVNEDEVVAEWLYYRPGKKEIELFYRTLQVFESDDKRMSKVAFLTGEKLVRKNSLLLSVLAQFNDEIANRLLDYFRKMDCVSGLEEMDYKNNSLEKVQNDPVKRAQIMEFLKGADLGIQELRYEDISDLYEDKVREVLLKVKHSSSLGDPHVLARVRTKHQIYDDANKPAGFDEFSMSNDESHGTQKYFYFAGLILDALEDGMVLFVDELDSKLHPNLVCKIVSLFNSKKTNPRNAQLIFNTHDTNLLSAGIFRRDQIWFISKDRYGAAKMYSLANFKNEVRKNEPFEDNYIRGKYGATPFLNEFEALTEQILKSNGKAE